MRRLVCTPVSLGLDNNKKVVLYKSLSGQRPIYYEVYIKSPPVKKFPDFLSKTSAKAVATPTIIELGS